MDLPNLLPQQTQPIQRTTAGQLPADLAELSEENLFHSHSSSCVLPSIGDLGKCSSYYCSYEGDEAE